MLRESCFPLSLFWNRFRREVGLADVRIHDLRHIFASFLVNAGHSLYETQIHSAHTQRRNTGLFPTAHREHFLLVGEDASDRTENGNTDTGRCACEGMTKL